MQWIIEVFECPVQFLVMQSLLTCQWFFSIKVCQDGHFSTDKTSLVPTLFPAHTRLLRNLWTISHRGQRLCIIQQRAWGLLTNHAAASRMGESLWTRLIARHRKTGVLAFTGAENAESCSHKDAVYSQVIRTPTQHVSARESNGSTLLHVVASSTLYTFFVVPTHVCHHHCQVYPYMLLCSSSCSRSWPL